MADDENTIVRDSNDWLLEFLVDLADKKVELVITLQIGGMLVSGILASGEAYFDAVGSQLSDAKAPEDMKRAMSQLEDLYRKEANAERDPAITVIHLKEARFFMPGSAPIPTNQAVWWRGRLSEVAGFVIGGWSIAHSRKQKRRYGFQTPSRTIKKFQHKNGFNYLRQIFHTTLSTKKIIMSEK